jgi:cytochrome c
MIGASIAVQATDFIAAYSGATCRSGSERYDMRRVSFAVALGASLLSTPICGQDATSAGRPEAGANVFKKCMACHQLGENSRNGIGPALNGVVGRPAGTYPGYNYSTATRNAGLVWDEPTLARYLRSPRSVVPGTRMAFSGLTKDQEIMDVIAYMEQFDAKGRKRGDKDVRIDRTGN